MHSFHAGAGAATATLAFLMAMGPCADARPAAASPRPAVAPAGRPAATPPANPTATSSRETRLEKRIKALEKRLKQLENAQGDAEVKQMITESKIESLLPEKKRYETKTFTGHARSLQGLNPELSVTGDLGGTFYWSRNKEYQGDERSGFWFRTLGLHFQSALDPFSFMKAAVEVHQDEVEFAEGYIVFTGIGGVMNITAGKFRQQVGVVNRWHQHALDQFDWPLMIKLPFGPDGLNQLGFSLDFQLKHLIAQENEITLQITNGMNETAFEGSYYSLPTTLVHFKNYWDLTRSTYLEFGLTGIVGFNHHRGESSTQSVYTDTGASQLFGLYDADGNPVRLPFAPEGALVDEGVRVTAFGGADLTIQWEPVNKAKYRNIVWRTEFLYGYKQLAPDATGAKQAIHWMGGYSYLQSKLTRSIDVGVRGDLVQEFALDNRHDYRYQVAPYFTWRQSPWVHIHLEYNYLNGTLIPATHRAIVQVIFAAGPHKHDRY